MSRPSPLAALIALATPIAMGMGPAHAAAPMALNGQLLVESLDKGHRTLSSEAQVQSGERLIFLIRYRNMSGAALPGYDFVAPVPRGVRILPDRADAVRVSADGGHSWTRPDSPLRLDAQGHFHPASETAPTHVRLRLGRPIAPGETGTVAYRGLLL